MELKDFLKVKQVRCVDGVAGITTGKVYDVIGLDETYVHVTDDDGEETHCWYCRFEPVPNQAENPLQGVELTPEFETEASEPKFKVGDKVYLFGTDYIEEITKIIGANVYLAGADFDASVSIKEICHATQENYERLKATFPHINFEKPPKELMGSDLCFKKLKSGKKLLVCAVSDLSDEKAIKRLQDGDNCIRIIKDCDPAPYHFIDANGIRHSFAVPLNDETGLPLTEAVLDE